MKWRNSFLGIVVSLCFPLKASACICTEYFFIQSQNLYIVQLDDPEYEAKREQADKELEEIEERYGFPGLNGLDQLIEAAKSGDEERLKQIQRTLKERRNATTAVDSLWEAKRRFKVIRVVRGEAHDSIELENNRRWCNTIDVKSNLHYYLTAIPNDETHKINGCNTRKFLSIEKAEAAARRYEGP